MKNVIRDFFVSQLSTLSKATLEFTTQKVSIHGNLVVVAPSILKSRLRSALVETIASDQEEENANRHSVPSKRQADQASALPDSSRRRPLQPIDETVQPTYDDKDNVWLRWAHFLGDPNNIKQWTHLSPERHKMIWCGPMVRRRSSLPSDLFSSLNENIPMIDKQLIDKNLNPIFLAVCDAVSQREMDDAIDALRVVSAGNDGIKAERKLLVSICDTL
ncbi:hypothetical protein DM01DRAFT_1287644 [Hesseltinella vesiculosa]|uniref:Uncharacterized protein n=1 Tax=Hesseltinella vesiculosa TaxID=101127 RepID=A0A1X2GH42_9FUNG|nr:hypothetical protein DM01DRAFT_1287644 [Hesseltinella vesiculosa]